jgi:hypothetical protein
MLTSPGQEVLTDAVAHAVTQPIYVAATYARRVSLRVVRHQCAPSCIVHRQALDVAQIACLRQLLQSTAEKTMVKLESVKLE